MKKTKNKIGWQKYEDVIENQMSSPLTRSILEQSIIAEKTDQDDHKDDRNSFDNDEEPQQVVPIFAISEDMMNDLAIVSNFDCWVGHTNFNITPSILRTLNSVEGIEVLKLFSRYRFFVGVGRMFNFKDVRHKVENQILTEE